MCTILSLLLGYRIGLSSISLLWSSLLILKVGLISVYTYLCIYIHIQSQKGVRRRRGHLYVFCWRIWSAYLDSIVFGAASFPHPGFRHKSGCPAWETWVRSHSTLTFPELSTRNCLCQPNSVQISDNAFHIGPSPSKANPTESFGAFRKSLHAKACTVHLNRPRSPTSKFFAINFHSFEAEKTSVVETTLLKETSLE